MAKTPAKSQKQNKKLVSPQERGRKGGQAAQRSPRVHKLTVAERAKGGKNSRRALS